MKAMKKVSLLCLLLLTGAASLRAEDFAIGDATVAAGQTVDVELSLNCESDKWGGFQFDLRLPEGVTIFEDEEGFYCVQEDRLTYTYRNKPEYFGIDVAQLEDGSYRFLVDNNRGKTIPGASGTLMTIRLVCAPTVATKSYSLNIFNQKLSNVDGSESVKPADNATAGTLIVRMDTKIGSIGYATYSWPLALDFTDTDVEAYIATKYADGWLYLKRVMTAPASTGLILRGPEGVYHPTTLDISAEDVSGNVLIATDDGAIQVPSGAGWYALADNSGVVGFYPVREGVTIPQYKSYFILPNGTQTKQFIGFDGLATGISHSASEANGGQWFYIDGMVGNSARKGVNIHQGHKILIK